VSADGLPGPNFKVAALLGCQRTGIGQPERLCGVAVFVDEAAEAVDSFDGPNGAGPAREPVCRSWGLQVEAAVWPGRVVVLDVDGQDVFEVAAVADQEPVQAFGPAVRTQRSA
jgi:hypothetical protein